MHAASSAIHPAAPLHLANCRLQRRRYSHKQQKHPIYSIFGGLHVIDQINPVPLEHKANAPFACQQTQIGVIARERDKTAPSMARQTAEGNLQDMRWVDHQAYIFLLINAIKEQQHQLQ